jgi:hypothetical protein
MHRTDASNEEDPMDARKSNGQVTLNAEGKQYNASFQFRDGVITVTSGSASRFIRVGKAVTFPESVARTILRTMVRENDQLAEAAQETHDR